MNLKILQKNELDQQTAFLENYMIIKIAIINIVIKIC